MAWPVLKSYKDKEPDRPRQEPEPAGDPQLVEEILQWTSVENFIKHRRRGEDICKTYERLLMLIWAVKNSDRKQALDSERDATVSILCCYRG